MKRRNLPIEYTKKKKKDNTDRNTHCAIIVVICGVRCVRYRWDTARGLCTCTSIRSWAYHRLLRSPARSQNCRAKHISNNPKERKRTEKHGFTVEKKKISGEISMIDFTILKTIQKTVDCVCLFEIKPQRWSASLIRPSILGPRHLRHLSREWIFHQKTWRGCAPWTRGYAWCAQDDCSTRRFCRRWLPCRPVNETE